ncbi:MAG: bifunctional 4-hydroxy-2-oxoglutarate aldolase/2-dehydro-3-deoxy-phosphogluconate aldolase [Rhodothalassiaceae bacterium]
MNIGEIMRRAPVIPVITLPEGTDAVAMARTLVEAGLPVLEITLRTAGALAAIAAISKAVPAAIVGGGTVRRGADLAALAEAGARFAVSPGLTPGIRDAARRSPVPLLPGVATASEIMAADEAGFSALKFFPAAAAGGVAALGSFAGPFPDILFCPTGGVRPDNAPDFLALRNVACVGGTWITPPDLLRAGDWPAIAALARAAAGLVAAA